MPATRPGVDAETPFALLGLDSLATIELAAALEDELGCELPPTCWPLCTDARPARRPTAIADGLTHARR